MNTVLILTQNLLAENDLRQKLELLGYEVLCSNSLVNLILNDRTRAFNNLSVFEIIIFSETLSDDTTEQLLRKIAKNGIRTYRVDEGSLIEDFEEMGLSGWLTPNMSLKEIREVLIKTGPTTENDRLKMSAGLQGEETEQQSLQNFLNDLSKNERRAFNELYQANGEIVGRNELASCLWSGETTQSNLAQLSQIIRKLRQKMENENIDGNYIITNWRKGYYLSKHFCEQIAAYENQQLLNHISV
ncbi:helix-turn-helix domain-containing protein [Enterococcus sp. ALS3]|uniref:Helix-turn-helix domain-containing protein n=1 Tax=Enterococcus alishanensis TaxID=1303817 RepID=A0ABS6T9C5_9ENTE|nr:helix-turn-helix domain-containing protein [Enterococcus alishanensis]MBV7389501.1 helix-turn-helix domain-containing protein [Enterococcus alishanensis]